MVSEDHQQEMAYGQSNGHVTDDVTWSRKVKLMTLIRLECNISKTAGDAIAASLQSAVSVTACEAVYGRLSQRQLGFLSCFSYSGTKVRESRLDSSRNITREYIGGEGIYSLISPRHDRGQQLIYLLPCQLILILCVRRNQKLRFMGVVRFRFSKLFNYARLNLHSSPNIC